MNQVIEISLDDLGRIVIPAELQSHLGLSPGMTLIVEQGDNDGLRLRLLPESPELIEKGGVLVVRQVATLNDKDFRRIYPELVGKIVSP